MLCRRRQTEQAIQLTSAAAWQRGLVGLGAAEVVLRSHFASSDGGWGGATVEQATLNEQAPSYRGTVRIA